MVNGYVQYLLNISVQEYEFCSDAILFVMTNRKEQTVIRVLCLFDVSMFRYLPHYMVTTTYNYLCGVWYDWCITNVPTS